jgi:uncharacterized coiled-coil DUF342 family protein
MKKFILILGIGMVLWSCATNDKVHEDIKQIKEDLKELKKDIKALSKDAAKAELDREDAMEGGEFD